MKVEWEDCRDGGSIAWAAGHTLRVEPETDVRNRPTGQFRWRVDASGVEYFLYPPAEPTLDHAQQAAERALVQVLTGGVPCERYYVRRRKAVITTTRWSNTMSETAFRARLRVESVLRTGDETGAVTMRPVTADDVPENQQFSRYTPAGQVELQINNRHVLDKLRPRDLYDVEFKIVKPEPYTGPPGPRKPPFTGHMAG